VESDRTRLGVVQTAVLEALDELGAQPDHPYKKCAAVVRHLSDRHGISPRYAYDSMCRQASPWLLNVPLVDFHGNLGSLDPNDRPSAPRYTEARLAGAGKLTLDARRGAVPPLPVGLINGDMYVDGTAPPFAPDRVASALATLLEDSQLPDAEIIMRVGPPAFPSGCEVAGDLNALAAGEPVELVLSARLTVEAHDEPHIVVSHLPYQVSPEELAQAIANRAEPRFERLGHRPAAQVARDMGLALPLRDVRIESTGVDTGGVERTFSGASTRVVCLLRRDANVDDCIRRLRDTWGVTTRPVVGLRAPLPKLLRDFIDNDGRAQLAALQALMRVVTRPEAS
jgi:hypothetical protein